MKVRDYKSTSLWKRTLGATGGTAEVKAGRERLARAYDDFRDRAGDLTNEIHGLLPNLTVHNVEHLDALWDVASTIAGDSYDINPLEAFVLGGGILVHDAGMALATFPGRMDDIRAHPRWKEHVAAGWRRRKFSEPPSHDDLTAKFGDGAVAMAAEVEREAAFDIVRAVHAQQAEKLPRIAWKKSTDDKARHLLTDDDLLDSYGDIIGRIAASHHWGVGELVKNLGEAVIPAMNPLPKAWTVDPIKVACLLRCADAANIDETRAPSFVYAMRRPDKVSRMHWEFQNRLLPGGADGDALVFHSKSPFEETDAAVWWLCYETMKMCNDQLAQSDALLRDMKRPPFAIRRVMGADAPPRLAGTVQVRGWNPVDTTVKVTDVLGLVSSLGGKQLYGDDPLVPLRELIQNAADAVRARRRIDPNFYRGEPEHRRGRITITVADDSGAGAEPDKFWLIVDDDGVGMREWVMTGPLLDFGTSLWRSDRAGEEFPGLLVGKGFEPTGRFGIGFYSVFMYADRVRVTSRPADFKAGGHGAPRTLEFKEGLTKRALVRDFRAEDDGWLGASTSTRVAIRLPSEVMQGWCEAPDYPKPRRVEFEQTLQWLVLALDVPLMLAVGGDAAAELHCGSFLDIPAAEFLCRVSRQRLDEDAGIANRIAQWAPNVRPIFDAGGRVIGRGVATPVVLGFQPSDGAIGGLSCVLTLRPDEFSRCFWGLCCGGDATASRESMVGNAREWKSWATEQVGLLAGSAVSPRVMLSLAESLGRIAEDVSALTYFHGRDAAVNAATLADFAIGAGGIRLACGYAVVGSRGGYLDDQLEGRVAREVEGRMMAVPVDAALVNWRDRIFTLQHSMTSKFQNFSLDPDEAASGNTAFSVLVRLITAKGKRWSAEIIEDFEVGRYKDEPILHNVLELKVFD